MNDKLIPCRLADGFDESIAGKPVEGSDVQFAWNHKVAGESRITKVIKNLLEPKISIQKLEEMGANGHVLHFYVWCAQRFVRYSS